MPHDDELSRFLSEDVGTGDVTSQAATRGERIVAVLHPREACTLAGLEEACLVFRRLGASSSPLRKDGEWVTAGTHVARISGDAAAILTGERLALNFLMRMSGIATLTRMVVQRCRVGNPRVEVAATRKTTPGFRSYEKKAVEIGGGVAHRRALDEAILIKDNHITVAGGIEAAIARVRERRPGAPIEVEAKTREEAIAAARTGVEAILLDNFHPKDLAPLASEIRTLAPKTLLEASGGIHLDNALAYARHVDRVSLGALTHSVTAIDFTMDVVDAKRTV